MRKYKVFGMPTQTQRNEILHSITFSTDFKDTSNHETEMKQKVLDHQ